MRAVIQNIEGDPSTLAIGNLPIPEPGPHEVLIRVQCAAINRMDLTQSKGGYPIPPGASKILGVEVSGTIAAIGEFCNRGFQLHENVAALIPGGGYAEFCVVDERTVIRQFGGLDMQTFAAVPEAFMTAYQLCFLVGNIQKGEIVILHAAASSIGQAAIQMLVRKGVKVFCTVRSEAKRLKCQELGAIAFDIGNNAEFAQLIREHNGGQGVNAILDSVGGSYLDENIKALEMDGRIVLYGLMGGSGVSDPSLLGKLLFKRVSIIPSTLRSRSVEYKQHLITLLSSDPDGFPAIASGAIRVEVDKTYDLSDVLEAHAFVDKNLNTGKVILLVSTNA